MKVDRRLIFTIAAMGGAVLTAVLSAKAGAKAERILAECEDRDQLSGLQKAKKTAKVYIPAVAACTGTIILQEMAHGAGTAALAVAAAAAAEVKDKFDRYVKATEETVGAGAERDIRIKASEKKRSGSGINYESQHTFCIEWLGKGKPIYFESSLATVFEGLSYINRLVLDSNFGGGGVASISDFLERIGHPELCIEDTDKAGWQIDILAADCGAYWIDSNVVKRIDEDVYDILLDWYPNYDIQAYIAEMEEKGII